MVLIELRSTLIGRSATVAKASPYEKMPFNIRKEVLSGMEYEKIPNLYPRTRSNKTPKSDPNPALRKSTERIFDKGV
jgi:hypothetical protein